MENSPAAVPPAATASPIPESPPLPEYKARIYAHYVHASGDTPLAPSDTGGLKPRQAYLEKLIRDHFPPDKNVVILDVGCGHGALLYFAQKAGYAHGAGVDVSGEQVEAARALGIPGVAQGDLMETLRGLPQGSQDVVVAFDILEHFPPNEQIRFVDEARRVLKPDGGRFIIHVPNGESPFHGRVLYGDYTHERAFTRSSMTQLLRASGFSDVTCFEDAPVSPGIKGFARRVIWKSIRNLLRLYLAAETGRAENDVILSQNFLTVAMRQDHPA